MPIYYVCRKCGEVIYRFTKVGQDSFGVPTPYELRERVSSTCPKCGKYISDPSLDDIVILKRGYAYRILNSKQ